jgi:hypothetical protein
VDGGGCDTWKEESKNLRQEKELARNKSRERESQWQNDKNLTKTIMNDDAQLVPDGSERETTTEQKSRKQSVATINRQTK